MTQKISSLAAMILLSVLLAGFLLTIAKAETVTDVFDGPIPAALAQSNNVQEPEHRSANLKKMGLLTFLGPVSLDNLGMKLMAFLGKTVVYASILGIMIGGMFLVFAGGDEGRMQRGKDIIIASVIGLVVTFAAYLIIKFVQEFIYAV